MTAPSPPRCVFVMPSGKVCGRESWLTVHLLLNREDQSCTFDELHHAYLPPAEQEAGK